MEVEAADEAVVPGGGGGGGVVQDLPQDAPGEVAGGLGVEGGAPGEGDAHKQGECVHPDADRLRLLIVDKLVRPGKHRRPIGSRRPVLHAGQVSLDPQLAEVAGAVEDPTAEELTEIRIPLEEEVPDGVGVDAGLGPHVAGFGEHPPEELPDPAPDRVVHLVLWNWFRRACPFY